MNRKTERTLGLVAGAAVGLASLIGTSGCSEFNPAYRPAEISSTHKQRNLYDFGQKIERLYESGVPWTLDDVTDTLYVRAEKFTQALTTFDIQNNGTYNELFEGARIQISFTDPRSGKDVSEVQIVANDGTIDSQYLGSFNAFTTRSKLDDKITAVAREKFHDPTLEVAVQQVPYPMAERSEVFLGFGAVNSANNPASIIPLTAQPLSAQYAVIAGPMADTKWVACIKLIGNCKTIQNTEDPRFVRRVIAYGPTGNFASGMYDDINFGNKDLVVGLGNRPLDNFQAAVGEIGETVDGITHLTGGYVAGRGDIDFIMHENVYLDSKQVPHEDGLQKAVRKTGEAKSLIDNANGIKAGLKPAGGN